MSPMVRPIYPASVVSHSDDKVFVAEVDDGLPGNSVVALTGAAQPAHETAAADEQLVDDDRAVTLPVGPGLEDPAELAAALVADGAPDQVAEPAGLAAQFHGSLLTIQFSGSSPAPRPASSALRRRWTAESISSTSSHGIRTALAPQRSGPASRRARLRTRAGSLRGYRPFPTSSAVTRGGLPSSSMSSTRPQRRPSESRSCSSSRRWAIWIVPSRLTPHPRWSRAAGGRRRSRARRSARNRPSRAAPRTGRWRDRP